MLHTQKHPSWLTRGIVLALGLALCYLSYWWYYDSLPEPLFNQPYSNVVEDRDGQLLSAHIASDEQWRFPTLAQTPAKFATALVRFEDKRFYQHIGIDPLALLRATYLNLRHGRIISGGSTISMQVIRLSRTNPPRTWLEKGMELLRALRLESSHSKAQILNLYASHAPFGGNVVGLEAAAWRYFGRSPAQLSWAESAMLAVLPNNPALIHLGRNRAALLAKRNHLLQRLLAAGELETLDYQLALAEPLPNAPEPLPRLAPHLLDTLANQQPQGKRFRTTIKRDLQQALNTLAARSGQQLAQKGVQNLAIVIIDNQDFSTLAYVGNRPDMDNYNPQQGHAIDMVQRPRSTGSTLKPFLLANMLEQGLILPDTLVADVPINYTGFTPKNYNRRYNGAVSAHQAIVRSLNIPSVNMLSFHGVEPFQAFLKQMGLRHLYRPAHEYGLSLILGGAESTLWDLTQLYANLAHRANQSANQQQAYWQQARLLLSQKALSQRATHLSTASAWLTMQTLLDVARPGDEGYWEKFSSSRKVAWKTGTSYGHRDAWAIGLTTRYTIGVWAGNASGEGRTGLTGTNSAAPILFNAFQLLPHESQWPSRPDWQMKTVNICQDNGYLSNGYCATKSVKIPKSSHFSRLTPHHPQIQLDKSGKWRVNNDCEAVYNMQNRTWFVLPPDQAYYYQQQHADYQTLPPFRADCQTMSDNNAANTIAITYPSEGLQIYLPRELDGKRNETIFRAKTSHPDTLLYWHLDNEFIGTTQLFHQQTLSIDVGKHRLTLVDEAGNRIERTFEILYGDQ